MLPGRAKFILPVKVLDARGEGCSVCTLPGLGKPFIVLEEGTRANYWCFVSMLSFFDFLNSSCFPLLSYISCCLSLEPVWCESLYVLSMIPDCTWISWFWLYLSSIGRGIAEGLISRELVAIAFSCALFIRLGCICSSSSSVRKFCKLIGYPL